MNEWPTILALPLWAWIFVLPSLVAAMCLATPQLIRPVVSPFWGFLDRLYTGFGALAAVFLIIILLIIMGQMGARWGGVSFPGSTAYAGYAMAASSFFALAYTLVKGAHIRVSILLQIAPGKAFWVDAFASLIAAWIATFFARFAIRAAVFSEMLNDRTQGQDQVPDWLLAVASMFGTWPWEWGALWAEVTGEWVYTPIWLPQISMAVGCVLLAIAMWDMLFRLLLNGETSIKGEAVE